MLLIVIVNYKTADLTIDCLKSLVPEIPRLGTAVRVVVVDNASPDDSVVKLKEAVEREDWASWCTISPAPGNHGFSAGNNVAIEPYKNDLPEYVLLLNPDTVVREGAIGTLMEFARTNPKAGIIGSRLEHPDGTPQVSAFNFPSVASELELATRLGFVSRLLSKWMLAPPVRDEPHRCDWLAGACMLIRREVLQQVGLLDPGYFMYYEEVDFCLRATRAGWECWYVPQAHVVHLVGQASGVTDTKRPPRRLPEYWFVSRQRYFQKNHGIIYACMADAAWTAGHLVHRVIRMVRRQYVPDPPYLLRDFVRHALHRRTAS